MDEILNGYVDLRADFTYPDSFDETPGEELAHLLTEQLPAHGISAEMCDEPDYAQYVDCIVDGLPYDLGVGGEKDEIDGGVRWYVMLMENKVCKLKVDEEECRAACRRLLFAIDEIIQRCDAIHDIRWYPEFFELSKREYILPSPGPIRDPDLDAHLHPLWRLQSDFFHPNAVNLSVWMCVINLAALLGSRTLLTVIVYLFYGWWIIGPMLVDRWIKQAAERRAREEQL